MKDRTQFDFFPPWPVVNYRKYKVIYAAEKKGGQAMTMPVLEGLRTKNAWGDEVVIYITGQPDGGRIKFVIADIEVRKRRTKDYCSVTERVKESYLYRCLQNQWDRKAYLADSYLKYVTEEQIEQALLSAWAMCRPQIA